MNYIVEYIDRNLYKSVSYFATKKNARKFVALYKEKWEDWKIIDDSKGGVVIDAKNK